MFWTDQEMDVLREHYPAGGSDFCDRIIRAKLGYSRGPRNIMQKAHKMGLYYQGPRKGLFQKGHPTFNKGKKMPDEVKAKCAPTMFKKGTVPPNAKKKGDDLSVRNHTGTKTLYIRLALGKWVPLSRHTYQSFYGPIPPGHVVIHKDGDPMNCDIRNLDLITRAENARRNANREKFKETHRNLTDEYILRYMKQYHRIDGIDLETARANGLIDMWREMIRLKRQLKKSNNGNQQQNF